MKSRPFRVEIVILQIKLATKSRALFPKQRLKKFLGQVLAIGSSDAAVGRLFLIAGDIQCPKIYKVIH